MSPRISLWRAARGINTTRRPAKIAAQLRFFLRACLRRRAMREWLAVFESDALAPLYAAQPRLALKLDRPYVTSAWARSYNIKLGVLYSHYGIVRGIFPAAFLKNIYTGGVDLLHIVNTTANRRLALRLLHHDQFEREGEITLALVDKGSGLPLVRVSFCMCDGRHAARRLFIGGLQACNDPRVRPIIHDMAKEMYGLRAKALALWCLQQLAAHWGVAEILGVDDAHHMSNEHKRRGTIAASYDEFWGESDGVHDAEAGFWKIPLQARQRGREELKASRRKQHELRYGFLGDLRVSLLVAAQRCELTEYFYASPEKAIVPAPASNALENAVSMAGLE